MRLGVKGIESRGEGLGTMSTMWPRSFEFDRFRCLGLGFGALHYMKGARII